ncbi:hypothetical protein HIM_00052 [Hirsutella minnesotensis 3608]|nr:hypothetical protein HIM_00052 [Hirsutella minnesotensis 3608]
MAPSNLPSVLNATSQDIEMLLAAQCHLGSKNLQVHMEPYLWKTRADGVNVINIGKTWEKIVLAARIIVAIDNPADICVISARPYGQRAVLKFAAHTGASSIAGRFTPGSFTNYITRSFKEPRLIIVTDPRTDAQAIKEASYVNIPVIALCDTDSPTEYVDVAIPTNNKGRNAIGTTWWLLAREVLRLRGTIYNRETPWDVMPDLYFYRDPEAEAEDKVDEEKLPGVDEEGPAAIETGTAAAGGDWDGWRRLGCRSRHHHHHRVGQRGRRQGHQHLLVEHHARRAVRCVAATEIVMGCQKGEKEGGILSSQGVLFFILLKAPGPRIPCPVMENFRGRLGRVLMRERYSSPGLLLGRLFAAPHETSPDLPGHEGKPCARQQGVDLTVAPPLFPLKGTFFSVA